MSVVALADRTVRGSLPIAFEAFIDFRNWERFMPPEFRPVDGPRRALRPGDRLRMRLAVGAMHLKVPVDVFSLDAPREVVWGGGSKLLHARHAFRFEDMGDGTTHILSHEDWTGLLARGGIGRRIKSQAELIGAAQLGGFAKFMDERLRSDSIRA